MCGCGDDHFGEPCPRITRDTEFAKWKNAQACIEACQHVPTHELYGIVKFDLLFLLKSSPTDTL
jgi:hypothetical protein